ncbi:MBL fold metallo-hydrolase [Natroniella sulfidigena]|uniref:MBL fold metallo-hydrolase n=1 Tax=Natroniella sulfidigena TaxID=723921 RepID=UPI00200A6F89|nr:MBL fold metallo-hydrolase [Natroniella sulfidigena]MCK8816681.1 MBL fold metallo-hydrolase [Natroniella sulfidigena]
MIIISLQISVLASGSSGNAIYVESEEKKLLIDAGLSGKKINKRLQKINLSVGELDGILLTHEHTDHIQGAGVLARRCKIPLYATAGTWQIAADKLGKLKSQQKCVVDTTAFSLGDCQIKPFSISHDAEEPVGYTITSGGAKMAVATDLGEMTEQVRAEISDSDLVILEANHDLEMLKIGPYPWSLKKRVMGVKGHLSNDDAGAEVVKLAKNSVSRILLAHLSKNNNVPELAFLTIKNMLVEAGIKLNEDIKLDFTYQEQVTPLYQLG